MQGEFRAGWKRRRQRIIGARWQGSNAEATLSFLSWSTMLIAHECCLTAILLDMTCLRGLEVSLTIARFSWYVLPVHILLHGRHSRFLDQRKVDEKGRHEVNYS